MRALVVKVQLRPNFCVVTVRPLAHATVALGPPSSAHPSSHINFQSISPNTAPRREQATYPSTFIPRSREPHPWAHAMTVGLLPSGALAFRLISRGTSTPILISLLRVRHDQNTGHLNFSSRSHAGATYRRLGQSQNYATGAPASRPGRPKAHTGRATASRRKTAATKKPVTKKRAARPKQKSKAKAKAKPKPKRKTRVLTEKQKAKKEEKAAALKQRELRKTALLTPPSATPPKMLPRTAYMVISQENQVKGTSPTDNAKASAAKYKSLTPEEREVR